jgi:hypothetical protein
MRLAVPLLTIFLFACAAPGPEPPSLSPRAAEAIDPRVPVMQVPVATQVSPAIRQQLDTFVAHALAGDREFQSAIGEARRLAAAAGARESESWVAAQQAISAAIAARGPVTRAIGDIDALAADWIGSHGGIGPADQAAIEEAAGRVAEIDRQQAATIDGLQARLAR